MDKKDLSILNILARNCRVSHTTIATALAISKDTVKNRIVRLENEKVITHYNTILDLRKVSIKKYHLFLNLKKDTLDYESMLSSLSKHPYISFLNTFIGKYDVQIIIDAQNTNEFEKIKTGILESLNEKIQDHISLEYIYDLKHSNLVPEIKKKVSFEKKNDFSFSAQISSESYEHKEMYNNNTITNLDTQILEKLCQEPRASLVQMAKEIGSTRDTIKTHIQKMIATNLITNFGININFSSFKYVSYCILLTMKGTVPQEEIYSTMQKSDNIFYANRLSGKYSIIMYVLANSPQELKKTMFHVRKSIGKDILDMEILIFDELYNYTQFPKGIREKLLKK
jgi:DNA-binding Lrp family transcriptional regulator